MKIKKKQKNNDLDKLFNITLANPRYFNLEEIEIPFKVDVP